MGSGGEQWHPVRFNAGPRRHPLRFNAGHPPGHGAPCP